MTAARSRVSAGILAYRTREKLELLLVHPGGPFFARKDLGSWTIPKGEAAPEEDLLARARQEFKEELGVEVDGQFVELGSIKQKGGKTVHGWAIELDLGDSFEFQSNTFEMEWPPRSGKHAKFPEVDQARYFDAESAAQKINPAQMAFIDRLRDHLKRS